MSALRMYDFVTSGFRSLAPVRTRPIPPSPPVVDSVAARSSVAQHGVTFTFDQAYTTGQFVNGDWWVIPAAPGGTVTVTEVTPAYDPVTTMNGWMVNPSTMTESSYDGRINAAGGTIRTIPGWNPALLPSLPLALPAASSVVKGVSAPTPGGTSATGHAPALDTAVVLTVLDTQPAADAFRPPYYGTDKPVLTYSQVIEANLPTMAPPPGVTPPTLNWIAARFARVQLDHYWQYKSRYLHPKDNFRASPGAGSVANYGADMAKHHNDAILRLMLNDVTWVQKKAALVAVLQAGIDWYGNAAAGGKWYADGGHMVGRKQMVLFAAVMFDHAGMKSVASATNWDAFSENGHVYAGPDRALFGRPEPAPGNYWQRIELKKGKRDLRDPTGQIDGGDTPAFGYQNIASGSYSEAALIARLLPGGTVIWNHDAFLEYADRWRTFGTWTQPDTETARRPVAWDKHGVRGAEAYRSAFAAAMWDTYRGAI